MYELCKFADTKSTQDDKCYKIFWNTSSVVLNGEKRESASSSLTHTLRMLPWQKHQPQSYEFEYCYRQCGM